MGLARRGFFRLPHPVQQLLRRLIIRILFHQLSPKSFGQEGWREHCGARLRSLPASFDPVSASKQAFDATNNDFSASAN